MQATTEGNPRVGILPPILTTGKNGGVVQSFQRLLSFQCFKQESVPLSGSVWKCVGAFFIFTVTEGFCWYLVTRNDRCPEMQGVVLHTHTHKSTYYKCLKHPPPWELLRVFWGLVPSSGSDKGKLRSLHQVSSMAVLPGLAFHLSKDW